jgi:hypothetical protein
MTMPGKGIYFNHNVKTIKDLARRAAEASAEHFVLTMLGLKGDIMTKGVKVTGMWIKHTARMA